MQIPIFDLVILLLLIYAVIRGVTAGFIMEIAFFFALILGLNAIPFFAPSVYEQATLYLGKAEAWMKYASSAATFLVVFGLSFVIARSLTNMLQALSLGVFNQILGGAVALGKYLLILSMIFNVLSSFSLFTPDGDPSLVKNSKLYPLITKAGNDCWEYLDEQQWLMKGEGIHQHLKQTVNRVSDTMDAMGNEHP